jgi:hypothetical protein
MSQKNRALKIDDLPRQQEELTASEAEDAKGGMSALDEMMETLRTANTALDGLITTRYEMLKGLAQNSRG